MKKPIELTLKTKKGDVNFSIPAPPKTPAEKVEALRESGFLLIMRTGSQSTYGINTGWSCTLTEVEFDEIIAEAGGKSMFDINKSPNMGGMFSMEEWRLKP